MIPTMWRFGKTKAEFEDKDQWLPEVGGGRGINRQSTVLEQ